MSTIRCEVTSSIQTRIPDEDLDDDLKSRNESAQETKSESSSSKEPIVEILLCIRPIRDGTRVGKKLGLEKVRSDRDGTAKTVSDSNMGEGTSQDTSNSSEESSRKKQPHSQKKRLLDEACPEFDLSGKKAKSGSQPEAPNDAAESLVSMSCTKT